MTYLYLRDLVQINILRELPYLGMRCTGVIRSALSFKPHISGNSSCLRLHSENSGTFCSHSYHNKTMLVFSITLLNFSTAYVTPLPFKYLPAATKLGQGNVFTGICDSVHRGGVCLSACWDATPPGADTPAQSRHPPGTKYTPWD